MEGERFLRTALFLESQSLLSPHECFELESSSLLHLWFGGLKYSHGQFWLMFVKDYFSVQSKVEHSSLHAERAA